MELKTGDIIEFENKNYVILNCIEYKKEQYCIVSDFYEKFEIKEPNIFMVKNNSSKTNDEKYDLTIMKDQKQIENVLKEMKI